MVTGSDSGHILIRLVRSIRPVLKRWGVGIWSLPLLFFWVACGELSSKKRLSKEALPDTLQRHYLMLIYPYLAGPRAAQDSIWSYRWEMAEVSGDTVYFGISRPTRSLYPNRREAIVGRFVPRDTGLAYYEELFWTYRFRSDTLGPVMAALYEQWKAGKWDTMTLMDCCVIFPDLDTRYDVQKRRWLRRWPL